MVSGKGSTLKDQAVGAEEDPSIPSKRMNSLWGVRRGYNRKRRGYRRKRKEGAMRVYTREATTRVYKTRPEVIR